MQFERIFKIDPVHSDHQNGLELLIESAGINETSFEPFDSLIIKSSDDRISMVIDNIFQSGKYFFLIELDQVKMLQD